MRLPFATTFNKPVVLISLLFCSAIIGVVLLDRETAITLILAAREQIFHHFGWVYILTSAFFIFFLGFLVLSRYGDTKLGDDESEPELSLTSWFALLFTAGMGIGIIFLGVAEPLSHALFPLSQQSIEQKAVFQSIFHWSINAWAIYGLIALAIAYFGFRYKLPLSLRSCFYPLLKQRINGKLGDVIDILGLCATIFGLITTLAYSAIRLNAALSEEFSVTIQLIIGAVFLIAIVISTQKITKGLRIISELSLALSLCLMLFVLLAGPTAHLLASFTENIGYYLSSLVSASFKTYIYEQQHQQWFNQWTILYWAWWFSWAPAFGLFIARISKGRTVREFILGVLIVPSLFFILWFSIFGNGAIWVNTYFADGQLAEMIDQSGKLLFAFLDYLPFASILNLATLSLILVLFMTTIDFGVYILNHISSRDKSQLSPRWQIIFWGGLMSITTFILFQSGGIEALQGTMLIFSLPFALLMLMMAVSLLKGLRLDYHYHHNTYHTQSWSEKDWRTQLENLLTPYQQQDILTYLKRTAQIAMRELRQELIGIYELSSHLETDFYADIPKITLWIENQENQPFHYTLIMEKSAQNEYKLTVYTNDKSYIIQPLAKDELIADILQQYETYYTEKLAVA